VKAAEPISNQLSKALDFLVIAIEESYLTIHNVLNILIYILIVVSPLINILLEFSC
jgi:hypothetical protein